MQILYINMSRKCLVMAPVQWQIQNNKAKSKRCTPVGRIFGQAFVDQITAVLFRINGVQLTVYLHSKSPNEWESLLMTEQRLKKQTTS